MLRRIVHVLAGLSLLLFFTSVSLCVRSYWIEDALECTVFSFPGSALHMKELDFFSSGGGIYVCRVVMELGGPALPADQKEYAMSQNGWRHVAVPIRISAEDYFGRQHGRPYFGFGYGSRPEFTADRAPGIPSATKSYHHFLIPWALPSLLFLILPLLSLRLLVRSRTSTKNEAPAAVGA